MSSTPPPIGARLDAWCALIGLTADRVDARVLAAVTDLVESTERDRGVPHSALQRFGYTLGTDGWPIAQVSAWLAALGGCLARSRRKQLGHYSALNSMAQGWAEGYVRGAHSDQCIDPTTGLVTAMVLRLRMSEVYQHAWVVFEEPSDLYVPVVVDIDVRHLSGLEAELRMATVAATVVAVFRHGDTIARVGSRLVVLAANSVHTGQRAKILADRLRADPGTRGALATVLVDSMPASAELVDGYLRDIAG